MPSHPHAGGGYHEAGSIVLFLRVKPSGLKWKPKNSGFLYVFVLKKDVPFEF